MRLFVPIALVAVAILPLFTGCRAADHSVAGPSTSVDIPEEQSPQDQALSKSVHARLVSEKKLDLSGITVLSKGGTVYLTGVVKSLDARQRALKIAWEVPGVQSVVNTLEVQPR